MENIITNDFIYRLGPVTFHGKSRLDNAANLRVGQMALAEDVIAHAFAGDTSVSRDIPPSVARIEQKRRSLVRPLLFFSTAFYVIGLIVLAYFPDVVAIKISGSINVAYVLALAQFVMTFAVAYVYARRANRLKSHDSDAADRRSPAADRRARRARSRITICHAW